MKKKISLLAVLLLTVAGIFAQAPAKFKYQAALRDITGSPLTNKDITVDIFIVKNSIDGDTVFTESHNVTTTNQGIINLTIGSVSDLSSVEWNSDSYFIKISVDGVDMGTSQLLSVPFAMSANSLTLTAPDGETYSPEVGNDGSVYYNSEKTTPLDKLVRREKFILDNISYTKYVHSDDSVMNEQLGEYLYDCSGFFTEFVLKYALPEHYQDMYNAYPAYHSADSRPRAWSYYDYFRDILGSDYDANDASTCVAENNYWKVFTSIDSVKKGDLLVVRYDDDWRSWYYNQYGEWPSTGHIMTVWGPPVVHSGDPYYFDIKILDASLSGHGDDSRIKNISPDGSGYGHGWMTFRISTYESRRPYKYLWNSRTSSTFYDLFDATNPTDYTRIQGIIFARPIKK